MTQDTTVMEYTAEDLIAHKLQRSGLLVAKPKFDQEGADLLALLHVRDGAKFCRIQSKGRTLVKSAYSEVTVKRKYVTDGFVLFLFVETGDQDATNLFCFLSREVATWKGRGDEYVLPLAKNDLDGLAQFRYSANRAEEIKVAIKAISDQEREFQIATATAELKVGAATLSGSAKFEHSTSVAGADLKVGAAHMRGPDSESDPTTPR